ncbi:hypothetical protein HYV43_02765 [Candidatus Micrarchaeota archaeon]|nr:hypothetical protein [Candidatus Micrarchaeota archaeon]
MPFDVFFEPTAERLFLALDNSVKERLEKKLEQLRRDDLPARHLKHGSPHFVAEVGQYRIAFIIRRELNQKRILFVGDHKAYERWFKAQEE